MPHSYTIQELNNKTPKLSLLKVISFSTKVKNRARFINVICRCGKEKEIALSEFTGGGTLSCGCLISKTVIERNTKYSQNHSEISHCWHDMIRRCYNVKCKNYKWYGAKGVIVCDEWINNYQCFLDWALLNGWQKGYHLDKDIKGNGKLYSPETCTFVTQKENLDAKGDIIRNSKGQFNSIPIGHYPVKNGIDLLNNFNSIK